MKRLMIGFVVWAAIGSLVYAQSGGLVRLKLSSGEYTVRPGNGDRISVHWEPNEPANKKKLEEMKKIKVHVETSGLITTIRTERPTQYARMVIEVPARTDLYIHIRAGDVKIEGIEGNTNIHVTAGDLKLDESCISNPKSEMCNWTGNPPGTLRQSNLIFRISDLRCRIRPISKFPQFLGSAVIRIAAPL